MARSREQASNYPDAGERSFITTREQVLKIFLPARDMVAAVGAGTVKLSMRAVRDYAAPGGDKAPVWIRYGAPLMTLFEYEMAVGRMRIDQGLTRPLPQGDQPPGYPRRG